MIVYGYPGTGKSTDIVVGAFPDGQSCLNLAAARLRHIAAGKWSARKYMNMSPLYTEHNQTEKPDLTLAEVGERLDDAVGYRPLPSIVSRFFKRHGLTRKKRLLMLPSKSDRM